MSAPLLMDTFNDIFAGAQLVVPKEVPVAPKRKPGRPRKYDDVKEGEVETKEHAIGRKNREKTAARYASDPEKYQQRVYDNLKKRQARLKELEATIANVKACVIA